MPANLTPDYFAAEQAYKHADTPLEQVAALERMFAALPKHKGTEKMQADIRRRLSEARRESQKTRAAGTRAAPAYFVKRQGAGQLALVGPPNSSKSQLVRALTHAQPEVADYPFSTRLPVAGMLAFEDVQIQLIDLRRSRRNSCNLGCRRLSDRRTCSLVADPNDPEILDEIEFILTTLDAWRVLLGKDGRQ